MSGPSRIVTGWVFVIASVCLIALSAGLLVSLRGQTDSSEQRARTIDLIETRIALEIASVDVVWLRMLESIGEGSDIGGRLDTAVVEVRRAGAELDALAAGDGAVAEEAQALVDDAGPEVLGAPGEASLDDVFYVAEDASRYAGRAGIVQSRLDAIYQAAYLAALPGQVLIEAIAADVSVKDTPVDPSATEFMDQIIFIVRNDGGWFGIDSESPLDDSEWIDVDDAWEMLPAEMQRMEQLFRESELVDHDAWLRELEDGSTEPPYGLPAVVDLAESLRDDVSAMIDDLMAGEAAAEESADWMSRLLLAGVAMAGLVSVVLLVRGVRMVTPTGRSSREMDVIARRDALTGVGNRHELDDRTRMLVQDPRFEHHLVAMVDLDSFKLVNDTNGHAAGDAVLVGVARGLERVAAESARDVAGVENSVIRLGGDEFLLTLHGPEPFDLDMFHERVDAVRTSSIEYDGDGLQLDFSLGIERSDGPSDLSDLMHRADLAVYGDKAARAEARGASMRIDSTGDGARGGTSGSGTASGTT